MPCSTYVTALLTAMAAISNHPQGMTRNACMWCDQEDLLGPYLAATVQRTGAIEEGNLAGCLALPTGSELESRLRTA